MSNIKRLKDNDGNYIYPVTHASAVFTDDGELIQPAIYVDNFVDDLNDHTNAIKNAIAVAENKNMPLVFSGGKTYTVSSTLTFNMSKMRVDGNKCTLDFSMLPDGENAILITTNEHGYKNQGSYIKGFVLNGNGRQGNSTCIKFNGSNINSSAARFAISDLTIQNFGIGTQYCDYSYCISHTNVDMHYCGICAFMPAGYADYGENVNFVSCTFYNSDIAYKIANPIGEFNITNSSIDYCGVHAESDGGRINISNSHIEGAGKFIKHDANGSVINIINSWLVIRGSEDNVKFVNEGGTPITVSNCFIETDFYRNVIATGNVIFSNTSGYATNNFATNFIQNTSYKDLYMIGYGGGTQTDMFTNAGYCEISTVSDTEHVETGDFAYKIFKQWGKSSACRIRILLPLRDNTNYANIRIRMKANSTLSSSHCSRKLSYVRVYDAYEKHKTNDIMYPKIIFVGGDTEYVPDMTINTEWGYFVGILHEQIRPRNASHLCVDIDFSGATGNNEIYIDHLELNEF